MSLYSRYAMAGAICASVPHTVLVPIDVVKTRLQTHVGKYNGMVDAFKKIPQQEGTRAIFLGLGPTVVGYAIQGACKFSFYEYFKHKSADILGHETASKHSLYVYLASSAAAEFIGTVCLCPWEALRIRNVSQPDFANNFAAGMTRMFREEGLYGFYKGLGPIMFKQIPYTVTQLTVFTKSVDWTYNKLLPKYGGITKKDLSTTGQLGVSLGCGVIAGVASAIASHPADTILSRINMIAKTSKPGAPVKRATVASIYQEIGFRGLWLGLGTRCLMVGLLSAKMFLIYDSLKVLCGLPTTSGLESKDKK